MPAARSSSTKEKNMAKRLYCVQPSPSPRSSPSRGGSRALPKQLRLWDVGNTYEWEIRMLTLYSFGPGANSLKPLLALYEKGLDFKGVRLNPAKFEHHED